MAEGRGSWHSPDSTQGRHTAVQARCTLITSVGGGQLIQITTVSKIMRLDRFPWKVSAEKEERITKRRGLLNKQSHSDVKRSEK